VAAACSCTLIACTARFPQALSKHVTQQLAENSPQEAQAAAGKEWVRGWDDYNK
jgi:hypothetical protein